MTKFALWLREAMKDAGMNQHTLAQRMGVSDAAVSKWLSGEATPDAKTLLNMAGVFRVEPLWLLKLAGYPVPAPAPPSDKTPYSPYRAALLATFDSLPAEEQHELLEIARLKAHKHQRD